MGFRTIVILNNDLASDWRKDETLGAQIAMAMGDAMGGPKYPHARLDSGYGNVAACQHADTQMLVTVNHFQMNALAFSNWSSGQQQDAMQLDLLKQAAEKLGYRLVKKG